MEAASGGIGQLRFVRSEKQVHDDTRFEQADHLLARIALQALQFCAQRIEIAVHSANIALQPNDLGPGHLEFCAKHFDFAGFLVHVVAEVRADRRANDEPNRPACGRTDDRAGTNSDLFLLGRGRLRGERHHGDKAESRDR